MSQTIAVLGFAFGVGLIGFGLGFGFAQLARERNCETCKSPEQRAWESTDPR